MSVEPLPVTPADPSAVESVRRRPRWPVVLFDFDGTLVDSVALIVASFQHALGDEVPEPELRTWIGRPLRLLMEQRRPGGVEESMAAYRAYYREHHDDLLQPVDGVPGLLGELRDAGAITGVVSSKRADFIELGLETLGLAGVVDVLASQDDTARHKPHPDPLLLAAHRLGVEPATCVYVGDAVVDIEAGQAAGMAAVGVTWGAGLRPDLVAARATAVVDDLPGLRDVLLG
jgi:pyrophosphatase PpaX